MNFVFISPQFPTCFWHFCNRLKARGINVLGIGDASYDSLSPELKASLSEYYYVTSLEDYGQVFKAVAYYSWKWGKIDWLESNNEYWLRQDARLREDFNIVTGPHTAEIENYTSKAKMKPFYAAAGVPSARQHRGGSYDDAKWFAGEVRYPLIAKPEVGMGANDTFRITSDAELYELWSRPDHDRFVLEEYVDGDIFSYDAILNANSEPLFESSCLFPPSMMDVVEQQLDFSYRVLAGVPEPLRRAGRATAKAFGIKNRFVHFEFFKLREDKPGLAAKGDFIGLEINVRPAGGDTPDMMNFAHSTDVFAIWADMVAYGERRLPPSNSDHVCVYASRRDVYSYARTLDEIREAYAGKIAKQGRWDGAVADDMGNDYFMVHVADDAEADRFIKLMHERA